MSESITFLTWKWHVAGSPRLFESAHVNVLYAMIARWYRRPFSLVCFTDDADGIDPRIDVLPLPLSAQALLPVQSPLGKRFPSCYCRLWTFSSEAVLLAERIFQLDIDCVIVGDLAPLVDRDEDFVGWADERFGWDKVAGGAFLLKTGALTEVWSDFDPEKSPILASEAGYQGSDQGWMSYKIGTRHEALGNRRRSGPQASRLAPLASVGEWRNEGLIKINWTPAKAVTPPMDARIVFTNGVKPPWAKETQAEYPWVHRWWADVGGAKP